MQFNLLAVINDALRLNYLRRILVFILNFKGIRLTEYGHSVRSFCFFQIIGPDWKIRDNSLTAGRRCDFFNEFVLFVIPGSLTVLIGCLIVSEDIQRI